jgi:hypothetical protein
MAFHDFLPLLPQEPVRRGAAGPLAAPLFSFGLLTLACTLASLVFACTTPFAAFAVMAATALPVPAALVVMTAVWIVNQAIGFGVLHYPLDNATLLWGFAIGAAALAGTMAAEAALRLARRASAVLKFGLAMAAAFGVYQLALLAVVPFLGGGEGFTAEIVAHVALTNIVWLVGLVATAETVRLITAVPALSNRRPALASEN